jgi:DNA-binding transcriptional LysR family regulator
MIVRVNLQRLKYFVAAAEEEHFGRVADRTPPSFF